MENEEWRPVLGWLNYEVSSHGRVRSLDHTVPVVNRWGSAHEAQRKGRMLKQAQTKYPSVVLVQNGKTRTRLVHHLVCEAFHGPRPEGYYALHGDDDPKNAYSTNLRWGLPKENGSDNRMNGGSKRGAVKRDYKNQVRSANGRFGYGVHE
jgi:NUMOD4 motif/HNH endonuclease